jgi:hypothetical protein
MDNESTEYWRKRLLFPGPEYTIVGAVSLETKRGEEDDRKTEGYVSLASFPGAGLCDLHAVCESVNPPT